MKDKRACMEMEVECSTLSPAEPCFLTQDCVAPENRSIQRLGATPASVRPAELPERRVTRKGWGVWVWEKG